ETNDVVGHLVASYPRLPCDDPRPRLCKDDSGCERSNGMADEAVCVLRDPEHDGRNENRDADREENPGVSASSHECAPRAMESQRETASEHLAPRREDADDEEE